MPTAAKSRVTVAILAARLAKVEARLDDYQDEFRFLRDQAKLTNKTLDLILATLKLHEVDHDKDEPSHG